MAAYEAQGYSEAFRLAMQMQGKVDKKGKLSDYDLGRLYRANVAAIEAEGGMDTTEAEMGVEGEKTHLWRGRTRRW